MIRAGVTLVRFSFLFLIYFSWVGLETLVASEIILLEYLPTSSFVKPNLHSFSIEVTGQYLIALPPPPPPVTFCFSPYQS